MTLAKDKASAAVRGCSTGLAVVDSTPKLVMRTRLISTVVAA
jgi:hypothetical protein